MMLNPMCMHLKVWCTESCWLFAHIWVVYKSRFHFLTSLCFLSLVDTLLSSGHGEYLRNMFPDTALHDSECARSQMWLLFFNVGRQACMTLSKWTIAAAADVHLFSEIHLAYFQVCWLTRRTQCLLVITEDSPAPSVLFWVSELAHFPSMLVQSFSTHFGQSPLVVLLFGSHALGLAVCQRWGTFPGSRCVDRPLFHIHLTQRGAIFKVCVFAIEFMVLYILKLPPIFGQMEHWRYCAYAGYNRLRDQHIVHLQTCKGHWKITPALSISASIQSKSEIRKESKKALQSLRLKGSPVLNSSCICFALKAHLPTMLCGN